METDQCTPLAVGDLGAAHGRAGSSLPVSRQAWQLAGIQAQWAITGSPSDGARAAFGTRIAAITAPATKIPAPHQKVAV